MASAKIKWKQLSFWERMDRVPPILIRIMARNPRGGAVTTEDLARRSGLDPEEVQLLDSRLNWDGVDVDRARRYQQAAGVDLADTRDVQRLSKEMGRQQKRAPHKRWSFVHRSSEPGYLSKLISKYRAHLLALASKV